MSNWKTYLIHLLRGRLDKIGFEEPVDPINPFRTAHFKPHPDPWTVAQQLVQTARAKDLATKLPDSDFCRTAFSTWRDRPSAAPPSKPSSAERPLPGEPPL